MKQLVWEIVAKPGPDTLAKEKSELFLPHTEKISTYAFSREKKHCDSLKCFTRLIMISKHKTNTDRACCGNETVQQAEESEEAKGSCR